MKELGRFQDHQGFDGGMMGFPEGCHHLELTMDRISPVELNPTSEDLLVFYLPEKNEF